MARGALVGCALALAPLVGFALWGQVMDGEPVPWARLGVVALVGMGLAWMAAGALVRGGDARGSASGPERDDGGGGAGDGAGSGRERAAARAKDVAAARARALGHLEACRAVARMDEIEALARAGFSVHASAVAMRRAQVGEAMGPVGGALLAVAEARGLDLIERSRALVAARDSEGPRPEVAEDGGADLEEALRQASAMREPVLEGLGVRVALEARAEDGPLPRCVGDIRSLATVFALLLDGVAAAARRDRDGGVGQPGRCEWRARVLPGERAAEVRLVAVAGAGGLRMDRDDALLARHLITRVGGVVEGLAAGSPETGELARVLVPLGRADGDVPG